MRNNSSIWTVCWPGRFLFFGDELVKEGFGWIVGGFGGGSIREIEGFDMVEDDPDEVFDLLRLGVFEVKLKCNGFAEIVWRNPVEAAFGDFVVAVFAAVFEQEFVEIELDFVLEG